MTERMISPHGDETARLSDERIAELRALAERLIATESGNRIHHIGRDVIDVNSSQYQDFSAARFEFAKRLTGDCVLSLLARLARAEQDSATHAKERDEWKAAAIGLGANADVKRDDTRNELTCSMKIDVGILQLARFDVFEATVRKMRAGYDDALDHACLSASHRDIQTNNG